jgi:hypothetical protein
VKWQLENRQRQYEKLFCYLETITEDEAERQLHAQGVEKTSGMRKHFFERFGSGQPLVLIQERVRKYMLAMPDNNGVAFPSRVNMPDKSDKLEEERNYLLRMCPKEKHKDYEEGKESTLIRNIINCLPSEYDEAVQNVRNLMRIREMVKSGNIDSITNLDDAIKINYDTSWLPPYANIGVKMVIADGGINASLNTLAHQVVVSGPTCLMEKASEKAKEKERAKGRLKVKGLETGLQKGRP